MRTIAQIPSAQVEELLGYTPTQGEVFSLTINPLWNAEHDNVQTKPVILFGVLNENKVILVDSFTEAQSSLTS